MDDLTDIFGDLDAEQNWLYHSLEEDFLRERGADSTWDFLRSIGFTVTRENFRDIYRNILGRQFHQSDIMRLADDESIPSTWFYQRHGWQLSRKFLYHYDIEFINPDTGALERTSRSLSSDDELSIGQIKDRVYEQAEYKTGSLPLDITNIFIKGVYSTKPTDQ